MYVYLWEFDVPDETLAEFMRIYGPQGEWADLFRKGPGYLGTHLLCDRERPERFLTIDQWESREAYLRFRRDFAAEHEALDARGAASVVAERPLGEFEEAGAP